jgi:hypothetical protein
MVTVEYDSFEPRRLFVCGPPRTCCPGSSAAARPARSSCPSAGPGPARRPKAKDLCPHTGRARLGYDRARILLDRYTSPGAGRPGLDLHQLRHSAATHLGEANAGLQLIMAKGRWRNPRTAMRYVKPGGEAVAEVTELLDIAPARRG